MVNVREDRSMAGLKAGFLQFAETVFAPDNAHLYQHLSLGVAENPDLLALAAEAKPGQYPAYVLFGAVHYLLLADPTEPLADFFATLRKPPLPPEVAFPHFHEFCTRREAEVRELVSTRLIQTNEVARSACLAPAFAYVARLVGEAPLHLIDIGAAAGLNLLFDRYNLEYGRLEWGDPASGVRIECELRSDVGLPLESWRPNVCHRIGIDLNPIAMTEPDEARWLRASVWPEPARRADNLAQAMAIVAAEPPALLQGDAVALLPDVLAQVPADETPCVYHSYALEYFSAAARNEFAAILAGVGAQRDLYFIDMSGHPQSAHVNLTTWRNGQREERQLAECPAHGQWLNWLARTGRLGR